MHIYVYLRCFRWIYPRYIYILDGQVHLIYVLGWERQEVIWVTLDLGLPHLLFCHFLLIASSSSHLVLPQIRQTSQSYYIVCSAWDVNMVLSPSLTKFCSYDFSLGSLLNIPLNCNYPLPQALLISPMLLQFFLLFLSTYHLLKQSVIQLLLMCIAHCLSPLSKYKLHEGKESSLFYALMYPRAQKRLKYIQLLKKYFLKLIYLFCCH